MRVFKTIMSILFILVLMIFMFATMAYAADGSPGDIDIPTEFFTWEYLGTVAGAVAFIVLFIQFTKVPLDHVVFKLFGKEARLPTRFVVWLLALIILLVAAYFTVNIAVDTIIRSIFNATLVAWTAMGAYEATFAKVEQMQINKRIEATCSGCKHWSGTDCTLVVPDTGCPYADDKPG